eukprot:TRINITY_DN6041_c0_g1_i11.p1 TRINITY_DN6041_c0_g1~~TRINITY_DN6041_c0_g1_i11.p1  ORF type:complete len:599 (-),score=116.45 TRINITY_DN6041_c0_g1_i11:1051-2847(-)
MWGIVVVLLVMVVTVQPLFEVEKGMLKIQSPKNLPDQVNSSYPTGIADFGTPLYGGTLVGTLVRNTASDLFCEEADAKQVEEWKSVDENFIVLIQRGTCLFAEKTLNAQTAGAVAVVIYDNKEEEILTMANPSNKEASERADKIIIPTVFLAKSAGDSLVSLLSAPEPERVVVQLDWTGNLLNESDARVEWDFWFSMDPSCGSSCSRTKNFIVSFAPQAKELLQNNQTFFTPHTVFRPCLDAPGSTACSACIKGGKYCAYEENEQLTNPKIVPEENLRSLCVYQQVASKGEVSKWWDYASQFFETCSGDQFTSNCSVDIIKSLQIDTTQVDECMGNVDKLEQWTIIENEMSDMLGSDNPGRGKIALVPTLVINHVEQYRGRLEALSVLRAICAGFSAGNDIPLCLDPDVQYSTDDCAGDNGGCWQSEQVTACIDTFRDRVCICPDGWKGDGITCEDFDECAPGEQGDIACNNTNGCKNLVGSFECQCDNDYDPMVGTGDQFFCVRKTALQGSLQPEPSPSSSEGASPIAVTFIVITVTVVVVVAGIAAYHYVYKQKMQREVRSIVQQYMPLPELPSENEMVPTPPLPSAANQASLKYV